MTGGLLGLTATAGVLCGTSAGVLFAFSAFVMPALQRLDPGAGVAAMQAINARAVTLPFMVVLLGGGLLCVVLLGAAVRDPGAGWAPWVAAGALLHLAGVLGTTVSRHVPLNDALATVDAHGAGAAERWAEYTGAWVPLNHVRAAAGMIATGLLIVGTSAA